MPHHAQAKLAFRKNDSHRGDSGVAVFADSAQHHHAGALYQLLAKSREFGRLLLEFLPRQINIDLNVHACESLFSDGVSEKNTPGSSPGVFYFQPFAQV